ncbi:MAG: acetyl-CoA carboxylase carboxyl transferase subunit beta, partial [Candidatus Eremiobacteraeota bacterium]|nr:acetyl-CoA carboxylase carboxyl transferase subunit beta [Candidatus Eremiobacteraeota bacterium]
MPMPEWLRIRRSNDSDTREAALWSKCPKCGEVLYRRDLLANHYVCTRCGHHFRMGAYDRISTIVD